MDEQELLSNLLDVWYIPEDGHSGDGVLRASLSGKKARYLAFELNKYPKKAREARTSINFKFGDLVHDLIRDDLSKNENFNVLHRELELPIPGWSGVTGHIDLILEDKSTGLRWFIDIKTVDQTSFIFNDPTNVKKNRYHACRNYTFDPYGWITDPFKRDYLYQILTYCEALEAAEIEFDNVLFITVCKSTGHIALGRFDWEDSLFLLDERDTNWDAATKAESPYDLDLCWEPDGDTPFLVCQYCDFNKHCFDLTLSSDRGRPKFKIKEIIKES